MLNIFDGDELKRLRADPFRACRQTMSRDELVDCGCIIYGAGLLGGLILSCLRQAGLTPICFVDRNPALHGSTVDGVEVRPPEEVLKHEDSFIVLASCYVRSIVKDNPVLAGKKVVVWSALREVCPVLPELAPSADVFFDNEEVSEAYALMADEQSRSLFKKLIRFNICYDEDVFASYDPDCYFAADLPVNHHRFVDAGAADGDTLRSWLAHGFPKNAGDRYYAFEPNPAEFAALEAFTAGLPASIREVVKLYNAGLGDENAELYLSDTGKSSRLIEGAADEGGGSMVKVVRLDDALAGAEPTLIKADVEGFELPLLEGAGNIIRQCAPDLAISVYHKYSDLWLIPLWIKRQNSDYALFLRQHYHAYGDLVCYARCRGGDSG